MYSSYTGNVSQMQGGDDDDSSDPRGKVKARNSVIPSEGLRRPNEGKMSDAKKSGDGGSSAANDAAKFCDHLVDDLIDFTTILDNKVNERREDPLVAKKRASEMYNEEIEFMNNYLKSLPNFKEPQSQQQQRQPGQGQLHKSHAKGGAPAKPQPLSSQSSQYNAAAANVKNPTANGGGGGFFLAKSVSSNSIHPSQLLAQHSAQGNGNNRFQATSQIQYNHYGGGSNHTQQPLAHYPQKQPYAPPGHYTANVINKSTSSSHIPLYSGGHLQQQQSNSSQFVDRNMVVQQSAAAPQPPPVFRRGLAKSFSSNAALAKILPSPQNAHVSNNNDPGNGFPAGDQSENLKRLSDFWSDNLSSNGRPKMGWNYNKIVQGSKDDLRTVGTNDGPVQGAPLSRSATTVIKPMEAIVTSVNLSRAAAAAAANGPQSMGYVPSKIHQNTELMKQQMMNEDSAKGNHPRTTGLMRTMSHNVGRMGDQQQQNPQSDTASYRSAFAQVQASANKMQNLGQTYGHNLPPNSGHSNTRGLSKSSSFSCVTSQMPAVKVTEIGQSSYPPPVLIMQQAQQVHPQQMTPNIKKSSSSASIFNSKLLSFMKPSGDSGRDQQHQHQQHQQKVVGLVPLSKCSSAVTLKNSLRQIANANQTAKNNFLDSKSINGTEKQLTAAAESATIYHQKNKEQQVQSPASNQPQQATITTTAPSGRSGMGNGLATGSSSGGGSGAISDSNRLFSATPAVPLRRPVVEAQQQQRLKEVTETGDHKSGATAATAIRSVQQPQQQVQSSPMAVIATVSTTSSKAPSCAEKFFVTQTIPPANKVVVNYPTAAQSAVPLPVTVATTAPKNTGDGCSGGPKVKDGNSGVVVTAAAVPTATVTEAVGPNPIMRTQSIKDARKNATAIQSDVARDLEKNLTELLKLNRSPGEQKEKHVKEAGQVVPQPKPVVPQSSQPQPGPAIYPRSKNLSYSDILLKNSGGGCSGGKVASGNLLNVNKNNILPLTTTTKYLLPTTSSASICYKNDGMSAKGGVTLVNKSEDLQRVKQDLYNSHEMMKRTKLKTVKEVSSSSSGSQKTAKAAAMGQGPTRHVGAPGGQNPQQLVTQLQQPTQQQHQQQHQIMMQQVKNKQQQQYPLAMSSSIGWFPSALQQSASQQHMMGFAHQQQPYALIKKPSLNQGMNLSQMGQMMGSGGGNHSNTGVIMMGSSSSSARMLQKSATQILVNGKFGLLVFSNVGFLWPLPCGGAVYLNE